MGEKYAEVRLRNSQSDNITVLKSNKDSDPSQRKTDPDAGSPKAIGYGSGSGTHTAYNFSQLSIGSKDFDLCNPSATRKTITVYSS